MPVFCQELTWHRHQGSSETFAQQFDVTYALATSGANLNAERLFRLK